MHNSSPQFLVLTHRLIGLLALSLTVGATGCLAAPGQGGRGPRPGGPRPGGPAPGPQVMNMDQTLSEGAQLHTVAFSALAFLTGSLGSDSFFPPGKVADWWGFQYMRDNDLSQKGHNTDFLTKAANNMMYVLTPDQKAKLVTLAQSQVAAINQYGYNRFPLMAAFRRLLQGDLPAGAKGLDQAAVEKYSADLYKLDGQISLQRAQVMGGILHDLNTEQRAYLDKLKGTGMSTWPDLPEQLDKRSMSHDVHVAVMTYAGDLFSWYMGSLEADVYFCPERQGTYFGSFYMKDAPAMGHPDYTIDNRLTGDMGANFVALLSQDQARPLYGLLATDAPLLQQMVGVRRAVATELRRYIAGETAEAAKVLPLCEEYGRLDGTLVYGYATVFAQLGQSLTPQQKSQLTALRKQIGDYTPQGAFLYSTPIPMPNVGNTDFLFGVK